MASRNIRRQFLGEVAFVFIFIVLSSFVSAAAAQTCVQPPSGIIAWWPFDEPSGATARDIIGNNSGVSFGGSAPTAGLIGNALHFDGLDDYVAAPDSNLWAFGSADFTIEFWANLEVSGGGSIGHPIVVFIGNDDGPGAQNKWFFAFGGGFLNFHINGPAVGAVFFPLVPFSPTIGQWYHLAIVRNSDTYTIFIDGVASGSATDTRVIPNPSAPLTIGQSNEPFGGFMKGSLDEVTVYNRALSTAELQTIVTARSAGKCKKPRIDTASLAAMKFGEFSSQKLDASLGAPPFSWSVLSGALPAGVTISPGGILSGTPTEAADFPITISVTDENGDSAQKPLTLQVLITLPPPQIRLRLAGMVPVPGRKLDVFAVLENIGNVSVDRASAQMILGPWHTLTGAAPQPDKILEIPLPSPIANAPKTSTTLLQWNLLGNSSTKLRSSSTLNPGQATVITFTALLSNQYSIGKDHRLEMCMGSMRSDCQEQFLDLDCYLPCLNIAKQTCSLPNGFQVDEACYNIEMYACERKCIKCRQGASINVSTKASESAVSDCDDWDDHASGPVDPNEKVVVAKKFIQPSQLLVYPIHFENIGAIAAEDIFITDELDLNLDVSTLQVLSPSGSFDIATRTVRWNLFGKNLQPGETGNVLFSIRPLPGLPSGTEIQNKAKIQFETLTPLDTAQVVNIIDSTPPTCTVNPLPEKTPPTFTLSWSGTDDIGEVASYSIFVATDSGAFVPLLQNTSATNTVFTGEPGKKYQFICIATDTAGNVETQIPVAETSTQVAALQDVPALGGWGVLILIVALGALAVKALTKRSAA